jgi:DNA polymerase III subunit epsilon
VSDSTTGLRPGIEQGSGGVLIERTAALLAGGPLSTSEIAEQVLGLRGSPSVAARAVWTLLASDARFVVSGSGEWSLRSEPARVIAPLADQGWVVVDVETTGGSPQYGHRITEVAAVRVQGGDVREVYSTLVNPGRRIPPAIVSLTGITDAMVSGAPRFRQVAPRVVDALRGRIFVAHNAAFDWRFVCAELETCGHGELRGPQLCTVRLARKLLPQLASRSLGSLIHYFGFQVNSRHRAEDDALATARVLLRFVEMLGERGVEDWTSLEIFLRKPAPRRVRVAAPRSMSSE